MGMGHSSAVVARARELAKAGFNAAEISRRIPGEFAGTNPAQTTVRRWIDPDYAERRREGERTGGATMRRWGWKRRLRRIRDLRSAGLDYGDIAKVMRLDFGLELSTQQTRRLSRGEFDHAVTRRLLGGEE